MAPPTVSQKTWNGPPPVWTKGPNDTYRCTRSLPDPKKPGEALTLSFPHERKLDFTLRADATDGSAVAYDVEGLPAGATFDRAKAHFSWLMKGKPHDSTSLVFVATTSSSGRAEWPVTATIVDGDQELAWRVGIGLPPWPDCAGVKAHEKDTYLIDDFDGDHQPDIAGTSAGHSAIFLFDVGYAEVWSASPETAETGFFELSHFDGKPVLTFTPPPPTGPMMGLEFVFGVGTVVEVRSVAMAE